MSFVAVTRPGVTRAGSGAERRRVAPGGETRAGRSAIGTTQIGLLRAAGNRATQRALASRQPGLELARCVGTCQCGGTCGKSTEPREELLVAGMQELRRAVLARERRTAPSSPAPAPAPAPVPAPTSASSPTPAPASGQTCGPDVSVPVRETVAKTKTDFRSWDSVKREEACAALENLDCAGDAWDIVELHNRGWLAGYAPCADNATPCRNTVTVDGDCSYAGSVNYVIFGVQCKLCDIWESTMEDMIWAYKGHHPFGAPASPNYGPSLEWARAGYAGWPAVGSPTGDRPACTGRCSTPYHSGPMRLHWYPTSPTETVSPSCQQWAAGYDAFLHAPPDYGNLGP